MLRSSRLAEVLLEGGLPEDEIPAKLSLFCSAEEALSRLSAGTPASAWWVPGRIEVFGKHTDYAGGESLLAAVPRGFFVVGRPRGDGRLRVMDAATGEEANVEAAGEPAASSPSGAEPGFARYVRSLASRLAANFPGAPLGADLAFASDLPQAAGLSSSSSLTVGVATALARFAGLEVRPEWRAAICTREERAGYFACLENGADFGPLAGSPGVGALTGSEDPTAILGCRAGHLGRFSYLPGLHHEDVRFPREWRFVIALSGVVAEKAGNARERYNRAARGVSTLLGLWNAEAVAEGRSAAPSLAAALATGPDAEARLRAAIDSTEDLDRRGELQVRLTHFQRENPRAAQAAAAFARADEPSLGTLADESQQDAEQLLGNQIPETSVLAALARERGAFAASAFGGGFGGAVWALVDGASAGGAEEFAAGWLAAYRERFPQHRAAATFTAVPGPALTEIPA